MAFRYSRRLFNVFLNGVKTELANGVIHFYTGAQPVSPDAAPTGTYLGSATLAGAPWTAGSATNGIEFGTVDDAAVNKATAEEWKFTCATAGTIGWGRFIANTTAGSGSLASADVGGADSTETFPRLDFSVGITSGDALMSKVTYAVGETGVIQSFNIAMGNTA
jgi:hypothetical protein